MAHVGEFPRAIYLAGQRRGKKPPPDGDGRSGSGIQIRANHSLPAMQGYDSWRGAEDFCGGGCLSQFRAAKVRSGVDPRLKPEPQTARGDIAAQLAVGLPVCVEHLRSGGLKMFFFP